MVMPRAFSSGALSIWSKATNCAVPASASTLVIAAVSVVLPWSMWPIVPMLQCGLVRSNFAFAIVFLRAVPRSRPHGFGHDLLRDHLRHWLIVRELHRVRGPALCRRPQIGGIAEHFLQ